jgi:hypothetical protein
MQTAEKRSRWRYSAVFKAAAICRTVRLTIYLRRRANDHDGEIVTAKALEALYPRRGFKVL